MSYNERKQDSVGGTMELNMNKSEKQRMRDEFT